MPEHNQNHFANNLSQFSDNDNTAENVNQQIEKKASSRLQNEIGSKVLSLVNFESKHKDIVESSFNKARNNKEKLPGKNNERRNFAYLSRLNNMIEKHGDAIEQKLWATSAENLVMDYEDIPEAYWKQQEQILRDNGQGRELSSYEKEILAEDLIDKQRQSITSWTNYLSDKNCPYPLWFKVYAFDGVSKMGLINKETKEFEKRDKTTVASFPTLNPEVLAKVYRNINEFYGIDKEDWLAQHPDDEKLVSLVKSGNFPKLYAKELFDTKTIIKTPEKSEDIEGDWFTYQLGDEDELAKAAEGTGWCITDPNVAHHYLEYGNYGHSRNKEADEESNSKAKFIVFKLKAPNSPDGYSTNGVASIRLDPDGKVAEISGLDEGQALEDSLVQTVKEKVLSLPGGKEFLQKFEDKQTLIKLDHKLQNSEDLTKEELSFLYELDRPIATLDTYNSRDPRIPELKEKYGIEYAVEKGVDANKLVSSLGSKDITKNLDLLLRNGADVDVVLSNLKPNQIANDLDTLIKYGANIDINELVSSLESHSITRNLDKLLRNGADIDLVVNRMRYSDIVDKLDYLIEHGANIDVNELVSRLNSFNISDNLDTLLKNGADIDLVVGKIKSHDIVYKLDFLLARDANIDVNELVSELGSYDISQNLDTLLKNGADINNIVSNMNPRDIDYKLFTLLVHGADIDNILSNMKPDRIADNLITLLLHGVDANLITEKLSKKEIEDNIDILREYGANLDMY